METRKGLKCYWKVCKAKFSRTFYTFKYVIALVVAIIVWYPVPSSEHFIWPLTNCILSDLCNHTWIPECGYEDASGQFKIFIDECDMYEYNCDNNHSFYVKNYSECFMFAPTCPTLFYRRGNYKYVPDGRRILYAPTKFPHTHYRADHRPNRTVPNLPKIMLEGKRRYTPEKLKPFYRRFMATSRKPTQRTTKIKRRFKTKPIKVTIKVLRTRGTVVLQRITLWKNGRNVVKIIKGSITSTPDGFKNTLTSRDSDFLEK